MRPQLLGHRSQSLSDFELPQTGDKGIYLKQQFKDKLSEHKQCINKYGQDMPEVRNWKWEGNTIQNMDASAK